MKENLGVTLIELMLALTLGLSILAVVFSVYIAVQNSLRIQTELSSIQENSRIAFGIIHSELQLAGYMGCGPLLNNVSKIAKSEDGITVLHASLFHADVLEPMQEHSEITLSAQPMFSEGDRVIISDCSSSEIFQVKSIFHLGNKQKIIALDPLNILYGPYAEVSRLETNTFFVGKTNRYYLDGTPIYGLYMMDNQQRKTELIENVGEMRINYSVVENGKLVDKNLSELTDANEVKGIEVTLTLYSPDKMIKKKWISYVALPL